MILFFSFKTNETSNMLIFNYQNNIMNKSVYAAAMILQAYINTGIQTVVDDLLIQ